MADTVPLAVTVGGLGLAWFGVHYWRDQKTHWPSDPIKAVLTGHTIPAAARAATPHTTVTVTDPAAGNPSNPSGNPPSVTSGSAQQILQQTATPFGWGIGTEWQALQALEIHEGRFDPHVHNGQGSGAYGMAQALGHGKGSATQGTEANEYGGFGLTDAQAKQANSGDAAMQSLWMCNYIKAVYTNPSTAWAKWQSRVPNHWY